MAETAALFDRLTDRYDAWYDGPVGRLLFSNEVACLAPLVDALDHPRLEVGVGSGRFARALAIGWGIDPARRPLGLAAGRGIRVAQAAGERLPFPDATFAAVVVVVTLCFADDPLALLAEARRVVDDDGGVVLGDVFAESPWGRDYQNRAASGHPFYSAARFLTREQTLDTAQRAGLQLIRSRSTLLQPPGDAPHPETPTEGEAENAGFVGWLCRPR